MLNLHKIWIDQCEAARGIEDELGVVPAMKYLVGEKFMNWQIAEYLDKAGWTEAFDASLYDDEDYEPEEIEMERKNNIRRVAKEMLLIERAKEWLLDGDAQRGDQT